MSSFLVPVAQPTPGAQARLVVLAPRGGGINLIDFTKPEYVHLLYSWTYPHCFVP